MCLDFSGSVGEGAFKSSSPVSQRDSSAMNGSVNVKSNKISGVDPIVSPRGGEYI